MSTEETWFFLGADDEQCGPVTRTELIKLVKQGHVPGGALIWRPGFDGWRPVRDVEELRSEEPDSEKKTPEKKAAAEAPQAGSKTTPGTAALQQPLGQSRQPTPRAAPKVAPPAKTVAPAKKTGRRDRTPVAVGAVFAVITVAAVAAMYRYSSPARTAAPPAPQVVAEAALEIPAEVPPVPAVVRVKNPFDESEVFEFPPGTPAHVARDKVADILMARAMERQKYLDKRTRTTKRR